LREVRRTQGGTEERGWGRSLWKKETGSGGNLMLQAAQTRILDNDRKKEKRKKKTQPIIGTKKKNKNNGGNETRTNST